MRILGIDPGTATTGYGLIDIVGDDNIEVVNYGVIQTPSSDVMTERLKAIFEDINYLMDTFNPDIMAIEELFFFKNAKTIITVSQARGVILVAGANHGIEIVEYTPLQVKLNLTGYGRADKNEMQTTVMQLLNLDEIPKPDDAADALAIALCHHQHIISYLS